jgi:multiple sugar transport system substrate-binding protein
MLKKSLSVSLVLALVLCLFAGCQAIQVPASTPDNNPSPTQSPTQAPKQEDKVVTFTLLSSTLTEVPDGDYEKKVIEDFVNANPNIKIETIPVAPADMYTKLMAMATANNMPDVYGNNVQNMLEFDKMGYTEDLNVLLGKEYVDGFVQGLMGECTNDGKLLYAPWSAIPTTIIYRIDMFEEVGITEAPKTWDEFTEVLKKLTRDTNGDGKIDVYGLAMLSVPTNSTTSRAIPMLMNFGGSRELVVNPDGTYTTEINTPNAVKFFEYVYRWNFVDKVIPPGAGEIDLKAACSMVAAGQAACTISGPHSIGSIVAMNPDLKGKLAGMSLPTLDGSPSRTAANLYGFSVNAKSSDEVKNAAAKYLKYLLSKDVFVPYHEISYRTPTRKDSAEAVKTSDPKMAAFVTAVENPFVRAKAPFAAEVDSAISATVNAIASGVEKDPVKAAADLEATIKSIIEKNK